MTWGPKKLRAYLLREQPGLAVPAASTIGDLLKREGLVVAERRRRAIAGPAVPPLSQAEHANASWSIDLRGWFRTSDGTRVDPLTVSDGYSRYLLDCVAALRRPDRGAANHQHNRMCQPCDRSVASALCPVLHGDGP